MERRAAFERIAEDCTRGDLAFPTSTAIALRIRRVLDDPECHVDAAARLIQSEPLLAARVVAMANSVVFNRSGKVVSDARTAISRVGFRTVRTLAIALVTRQMAGASNDPAQRAMANRLWQHTAHVAALAYVLAGRVTHQDAESALFAGIVHEVGSFYLLSRVKEYPDLLVGEQEEWVGECEARVGLAVLKALSVPDSVVAGIEWIWQGYLSFPPTRFGDTLLLADELAPVASPLHQYGGGEQELAAGQIESVVGQETLTSILEESAGEVESLTAALTF
jgi:HD-like signal output (HDOD) protein